MILGIIFALLSTVNLAWEYVTPPPDLLGFNIYRSTDFGATYQKINPSPVIGLTYTDNTAIAGQTNRYKARAINNTLIESEDSNTVDAAPTLPTHIIGSPSNFRFTCKPDGTYVFLDWDRNLLTADVWLLRVDNTTNPTPFYDPTTDYYIDDITTNHFEGSILAGANYHAWVHGAISSDPYNTFSDSASLDFVCNSAPTQPPPPSNLKIVFDAPQASTVIAWNKTTTVKAHVENGVPKFSELYINNQRRTTFLDVLNWNWRPGSRRTTYNLRINSVGQDNANYSQEIFVRTN